MPFLYPKEKKKRKLKPKSFSNYKSYKPFLQEEFDNRCIYCITPDTLANYDSFGVDHYRPKKKFPELQNEYSNLFYCCNKCNRLKKDYWPSKGREHLFVPNPCDYIMFDHLQYNNEIVISKTEAGKFTIDLLYLNDEDVIKFRHLLLNSRKVLNSVLFDLETSLDEIGKIILKSNESKLKKLLKYKLSIIDDINKTKNDINIIDGLRSSEYTLN